MRENLRDSLPGAGKRTRNDEQPSQHYRASRCEMRNSYCGGRGKADIAIQDSSKTVLGYVCQLCYHKRLDALGLDQLSCVKIDGITARDPEQGTLDQQRTYRHVTEVLGELDRYADSVHDRAEDDE